MRITEPSLIRIRRLDVKVRPAPFCFSPPFTVVIPEERLEEFFEELVRFYAKDRVVELILYAEREAGAVKLGLVGMKCAKEVESLCG